MADVEAPIPVPEIPRSMRRRSGRVMLVLGVISLLIAGVWVAVMKGYILQRQYESTAVIQVHGGMDLGEVEGGGSALPSPEAMEREARRVLGKPTLDRLQERIDLEGRWELDAEEVTKVLRRVVSAEVRKGTDLIEITVRHPKPGDARDVALGLAEEHRDLRAEEEAQKAKDTLEALEEERAVLEKEVERKRLEMERVMEEGDEEEEVGLKLVETLADIHEELELEGHSLGEEVSTLKRLHGEALFSYAAGLERPQNSVTMLYAEYAQLSGEIENLQDSGFGEAHPEVVIRATEVSMMKGDLTHSVKRMREVMEGEVERLNDQVDLLARRIDGGGEVRTVSGYDDLVNRTWSLDAWSRFSRVRAEYEGTQNVYRQHQFAMSTARGRLMTLGRGLVIQRVPELAALTGTAWQRGAVMGGLFIAVAGVSRLTWSWTGEWRRG